MHEADSEAEFMAGVEEVIAGFPQLAKSRIGYAIRLAQQGKKADYAHPLTGRDFRGAKVFEIDVSFSTNEYRAVYTIEFEDAIWVVDAYVKPSPRGSELPRELHHRILRRLHELRERHR